MNIAMFSDCYFPRINGVSVSILSFAEELTKLNHNVIIVCPDYESKKNLKSQFKFSYEEIQKTKKGSLKLFRLASHRIVFSQEDRLVKIAVWHNLKKYLDNFKPDIIHVNTEYMVGRFGSHYAKHRLIPMVYTFHTYWEDYIENYADFAPKNVSRAFGREISLYFLKRADKIIAPTKRFEQVVKSYGINCDITVIPTGISDDIQKYEKNHAALFFNRIHKIFPIIKKKNILLYVGRVAKEKNLDFLLEMLGKVRKTVKDAVLIVVGDGPELKSLKEKAAKLPYSWNICFTGYSDRDQLAYFYNLADVFVFPSLTETQGLVTIEAMSNGLPVVAIGEMGTLDVMQGNNGGFMVNNDIDEFSQKVIDLLQNPELRKQKSQEAKEWSKNWSIENTTQKLLSVYNSIIK